MDPPERLIELDGISGWASILVVCHHLLWCSSPIVKNPFNAFLLSGPFFVYVFFVVSGIALSIPLLRGADIAQMAVSRYPRLAIHVTASCIVSYFAWRAGLVYAGEAGRLIQSDWLASVMDFTPTFYGALNAGLVEIFMEGSKSNSFLWTMPVELCGSLTIFSIAALFGTRPRYGLFLIIIPVMYVISPGCACFTVGSLLARRIRCVKLNYNLLHKISIVCGLVLFITCVSLFQFIYDISTVLRLCF